MTPPGVALSARQVEELRRRLDAGGVAVIPTDTVYGLACDPDRPEAVRRLYALKRRSPDRAAAVMFCTWPPSLEPELEIGPLTTAALGRLLPGPVTVLVPNPGGRFPAACAADPSTLGVRVPRLAGALAPLQGLGGAVLQSSANLSGGHDPRRLDEVAPEIRGGADAVLDAGELPGVASTVVDLRAYEQAGTWEVLRPGAFPASGLERALSSGVA